MSCEPKVYSTDIILHEVTTALDALAGLLKSLGDRACLDQVNAAGLGNLVSIIHEHLIEGEQQVAEQQQRLFKLENSNLSRRFAEELGEDIAPGNRATS